MPRIIAALLTTLMFVNCAGRSTTQSASKVVTTPKAASVTGGVDVMFEGVECFAPQHVPPQLLLVRDPGQQHVGLLEFDGTLQPSDAAELRTAFGSQNCPAACPIDDVALRIVEGDSDQPLPGGFDTSGSQFDSLVHHLQREANPDFTDFTTDADNPDAAPVPNGRVLAWFDLRGGKVTRIDTFHCPARFDQESPNNKRPFESRAVVHFSTANPTLLIKHGTETTWHKVHLTGTHVSFLVSNMPKALPPDPAQRKPHFELFSELSISHKPLPNVTTDGCIEGQAPPGTVMIQDTVPGCSNSSWP